jgi:hypothetical protein
MLYDVVRPSSIVDWRMRAGVRAYCRLRIGPVTERARACGRLRADHRPPTCTERPTGRPRALAARRRPGAGETAAGTRRTRLAMDR